MQMHWKVVDAMKDIMNGEFGEDIEYAIDYTVREYNSDIHNVRKIKYADVIISALYLLMNETGAQASPDVHIWDSEDIYYWNEIVKVMEENDSKLTR